MGDLVILQKVEGMGQSGEMTMKIHGDSLRADVSAEISVIRDTKTGDSITLLHPQKTFMRISGAAAEALRLRVARQMPAPEATASPGSAVKLQPTGRKEKINNYSSEEYSAQAGAMKVRYWIAPDFPDWAAIQVEVLKVQQKGLDELMKGFAPTARDFPGMPIRTEVESNGQKVTTTIVSVKSAPIDPAQFQVPAAYKEMPAPAFSE